MYPYESQWQELSAEIMANWRLCGVQAVLYQDINGDKLLTPLSLYLPDQQYDNGWAVPVTSREIVDAASGLDGMVFYVDHDKIIVWRPRADNF